MPSCRVTNHTAKPLNICLKQVTALHFENAVEPGQTIKFKTGKVWFTLEALVDDETKKSRYSVLKSAATIALLSIAVGAVAATAGAALLPSATAATAAGAAGVAGSYLTKGATITKAALIKNSGTMAKLSSVALPKAVEKLSAEMGGLSALQREVLSIIASPTLSSDVRHKATGLLRQMHKAYSDDKQAKKSSDPNTAAAIVNEKSIPSSTSTPTSASTQGVPGIAQPSASLSPLSDSEARELEQAIENGMVDDRIENTPIGTDEVLRVHGIYMGERREFDIRASVDGKLELWDAKTGKKV